MKSPTDLYPSLSSYYPFGMPMLNRQYGAGYRFGFNGKEQDNEMEGKGDIINYGARIYDPRLGRFLSVDPLTKKYPWNSTYSYTEDNPIAFIDLDGKEGLAPSIKQNVIIIIRNSQDIQNHSFENSSGTHGNWHVIMANDFADANTKFINYTHNEKVQNLLFVNHGTGSGGTLMYGTEGYGIDAERINTIKKGGNYERHQVKDNVLGLSNLIKQVKDHGNVCFTACNAASGSNNIGRDLGNALTGLANNSTVNVYLSGDLAELTDFHGSEPINSHTLIGRSQFHNGFTKFNQGGSARKLSNEPGLTGNMKLNNSSTGNALEPEKKAASTNSTPPKSQ